MTCTVSGLRQFRLIVVRWLVGSSMALERIRQSYRPNRITVLFVGESPPHGGTFFYCANPGLFRYTADAFRIAFGSSIADEQFLAMFKQAGCYLEDLSLSPINHLGNSERWRARRAAVAGFVGRVKAVSPEVVVCVMRGIAALVRKTVSEAGFATVPFDVVAFPAMGHEEEYVKGLVPILRQLHASGRLGDVWSATQHRAAPEGRSKEGGWMRLPVSAGVRRKTSKEAAATDVRVPPNSLLLLSGIPAVGKSSFGRYLARDYGFAYYDLECYPRGWPHPELKPVWDSSRVEFVSRLKAYHCRIALDWGFPGHAIGWVQELLSAGAKLVWLEGDIARAREEFLRRGSIDVAEFDAQVSAMLSARLPDGLECVRVEALGSSGFKDPHQILEEIFRQ